MKVKKKTMIRDEWPKDRHKKVSIFHEKINGKNVSIGVILWTKGVESIKVRNKTLLIVDEGYSWLEIALEEKYYWITVMFDNNDEFIEAYFDLNAQNILDDVNPYFYDMFTDIVIYKDRSVHILDEEELDNAYKEELISEVDYERTKKMTKELYEFVTNNADSLVKFFENTHHHYKKQMNENML